MKELILLVGPPGSGKTTISDQLRENHYIWINQDTQGKSGHLNDFNTAVHLEANIVVDRMNFSKEQRARYLSVAKENGYSTKIIVLEVPEETCLNRCLSRQNHPTIKDRQSASNALHTFFSKYEKPTLDEAEEVVFLSEKKELHPAIIVDLDGTLCNIDHRLHFMKGEKKNWKGFFESLKDDSINSWCQEIIYKFENNYKIILCSGRPDDHRKATEEWLEKYGINYDALYMRKRNDFRPDHVVKEIIYDFNIEPQYDIMFAIDDRQSIIDMWRSKGITALQCSPGDF